MISHPYNLMLGALDAVLVHLIIGWRMITYSSNRTIKHVNHRATIIEWSQVWYDHRNIRHRLIQTALWPWVSDPVCKIKSCSELYKHLQHIEWYHKNQVFKYTPEWIFKSPPKKKLNFGLHYLPANSLDLFQPPVIQPIPEKLFLIIRPPYS